MKFINWKNIRDKYLKKFIKANKNGDKKLAEGFLVMAVYSNRMAKRPMFIETVSS